MHLITTDRNVIEQAPTWINYNVHLAFKTFLTVSKHHKLISHMTIHQNHHSSPLQWPLSRDLLMRFYETSFYICSCMALWNDMKASLKPHADISMWRGILFCAIGVDLCKESHNTVNSFDQIMRTSRAVTYVSCHRYAEECDKLHSLPLNKQLGHVSHVFLPALN